MGVIETGNAAELGVPRGGWFLGHFAEGALHCREVEVKWANHPAESRREAWAPGADVTTLTILVRGRFRLGFDGGREVILSREGDFALWGPGVGHTWECVDDCVLVTVRWPSGG